MFSFVLRALSLDLVETWSGSRLRRGVRGM